MVLLTITPTILSALESLSPSLRHKLSLPTPELHTPISHTQLIALSQSDRSKHPSNDPVFAEDRRLESGESKESKGKLRNQGQESSVHYSLNALVRGAKLYIPPPPPKPQQSPEYVALKAKLEGLAEANAYNALLHHVSYAASQRKPLPIFSSTIAGADLTGNANLYNAISSDIDSDPITPSLILNILVSILLTGFSAYWALSHFRIPKFLTFSTLSTSYPGSPSSQPIRVFFSLLVAIAVAVAEVVVYAAYLRKVDRARSKESGIVEKKELIGEVMGDSETGEVDKDCATAEKGEQAEMGKEINGRARRRIRGGRETSAEN